jgi:hypothetical protein
MPVDKFGRTDGGGASNIPAPIQRVVSGGVTLSQMTETFLQRDGGNMATGNINLDYHKVVNVGNPTDDQDAATKNYVDRNTVSKTGDTITGDLSLSIGTDSSRTMGCKDLGVNAGFKIYLGDDWNLINFTKSRPVLIQTSNGLKCNLREHDIARFGTSLSDVRVCFYQDVLMNHHFIANLHDPNSPQDAATKNYVDSSVLRTPKKNLVGYIPLLEGNFSTTGFIASASSSANVGSMACKAFNSIMKGFWSTSNDRQTGWLQIKCPDQVRIWRVALKARNAPGKNITGWNLSASNDETAFTTLLTSTTALEGASNSPSFFNVATTEFYSFYRLNITVSTGSTDVGVQYMQLFVYDV